MQLTPPVGIYFMTVAFTPLLRKSSDPSVIVISSLSGITNQRCVSQWKVGFYFSESNQHHGLDDLRAVQGKHTVATNRGFLRLTSFRLLVCSVLAILM